MTSDVNFASEQAMTDKQDELRRAKEVAAGPVPLIRDASDPSFTLPRGLFRSGVWEREVTVRELNGADEEALGKAKDGLAYFNTVLAAGTVSIGTIDMTAHSLPEREFYLNDLLIGEREQLFLKIVQVSFGNERPITFSCTVCAAVQDVNLLLGSDFPPKVVEDIEKTVLEFTTSKGDKINYRAALGSDQSEVMEKRGASNAEQNTIMLSRCITKVNDQMVVDPMGLARTMSMRDRQKLLELLVDRQPTIDLNVKTTCASCGSEQTLNLGWMDFFRP